MIKFFYTFLKSTTFLKVLVLSGLLGCSTTQPTNYTSSEEGAGPAVQEKKLGVAAWEEPVEKGIRYLVDNDLSKASTEFNLALSYRLNNSGIQFLNAYTYHLMALNGKADNFALAEEGYNLAIKFDSSNWLARYQKGLLEIDTGRLNEAKITLADTLIDRPDDPEILRNLIYASYYSGDLQLAGAAVTQLCDLQPSSSDCLERKIMIDAAFDISQDVQPLKTKLLNHSSISNERKKFLLKRTAAWLNFHRRFPREQPTNSNRSGISLAAETSDTAAKTDESTPVSPVADLTSDSNAAFGEQMVITDVVIINSIEESTTSKGVNLLNALTFQWGSSTNSLDAFYTTKSKVDVDGTATSTSSVVSALSIPAITYSLNIANAATARNEILARPTLVAHQGETSSFFSGNNLQAGATSSGNDGTAIQIAEDIGVNLSITPSLVTENLVNLGVEVSRTFITSPSSNVNFTYQVNQSKTSAKSTVSMRRGDTLILSGLSEKEKQSARDGVPILEDIPIIQYLFSKETTKSLNRSVIILITPRQPEFIYLSKETRDKIAQSTNKTQQEVLNEFRGRYIDWFKPYPNWASTFKHLQNNKLYREFRTGDVALETWQGLETRSERLGQVKDFLYY